MCFRTTTEQWHWLNKIERNCWINSYVPSVVITLLQPNLHHLPPALPRHGKRNRCPPYRVCNVNSDYIQIQAITTLHMRKQIELLAGMTYIHVLSSPYVILLTQQPAVVRPQLTPIEWSVDKLICLQLSLILDSFLLVCCVFSSSSSFSSNGFPFISWTL